MFAGLVTAQLIAEFVMRNGMGSNHRFLTLESWRGACALLVAIHNLEHSPQAPAFVQHCSLFVDFFFVLSGFVISHAYMRKLNGRFDLGLFLLRRFGRLWPLHVAVLFAFVGLDALMVVVEHLHPSSELPSFQASHSIYSFIENLFLVQAIGVKTTLSWNVTAWSISTEFWTYLLFGFICIVTPHRPPAVSVSAGYVVLAGSIIFFLSPSYLDSNTDYAIFRCIYGFFIGHLTYRIWEIRSIRPRMAAAMEIPTVIAVVVFVTVERSAMSLAAPILFGFAVLVFAYENGTVSSFLKMRPFVQLGLWSYSIYMVHWFVRIIVLGVVKIGGGRSGQPIEAHLPWGGIQSLWGVSALIVVYLFLVIAVSAITYGFIEQPSRRYFNRIAVALKAKYTG
jgi:peptidoglycan/LPS O-acetylase OafA/YrhL